MEIIGFFFPILVIYVLSFFRTEGAKVGEGNTLPDAIFSLIGILSYTGPLFLIIAILIFAISADTFGKIFDTIIKKKNKPNL